MARILLVNKFYYPRGGDCIATLATEQLLSNQGHQVAVFAMQHPNNLYSVWENYFPCEISFTTHNVNKQLQAAVRPFYSIDVVRKFKKILQDFKPQVVHLHNIHSYLSPVVAKIAKQKNIRVVWTMHDHKLICPAYLCLRNGKPCELCFKNKLNVVKYRCVKNSTVASLLACAEALYWNARKLQQFTDRFVCPSQFLKYRMIDAGFQYDQIEVLPNFMHQITPNLCGKENFYCYVGRISEEKGVKSLLDAATQLPFTLKIIGGGPLFDEYVNKYQHHNIQFLGQLPFEQVLPILQQARFMVLPSVCYENNPFSIIEALTLGTPVVGANIGGIPELLSQCNGLLFQPNDVGDIENKIKIAFQTFNDQYDFQTVQRNAQNKFSPIAFYKKLIPIYELNS
jgi:glycosyltransferase involved in cell wall biosynthesis